VSVQAGATLQIGARGKLQRGNTKEKREIKFKGKPGLTKSMHPILQANIRLPWSFVQKKCNFYLENFSAFEGTKGSNP
jgi:hypothetical protein